MMKILGYFHFRLMVFARRLTGVLRHWRVSDGLVDGVAVDFSIIFIHLFIM